MQLRGTSHMKKVREACNGHYGGTQHILCVDGPLKFGGTPVRGDDTADTLGLRADAHLFAELEEEPSGADSGDEEFEEIVL